MGWGLCLGIVYVVILQFITGTRCLLLTTDIDIDFKWVFQGRKVLLKRTFRVTHFFR